MSELRPGQSFDMHLAAEQSEAPGSPRARILASAGALFKRYGFSKTTINDIARDAEMSPANLYRFFSGKQAIAFAVAELYMAEIDRGARAIMEGPADGAEARLRALIGHLVFFAVDVLRATPKLVELAEMMVATPKGLEMADGSIARDLGMIEAIIRDGQASGEFREMDVAAAAKGVHMATKFFMAPFAIARHGLDRVEDDLEITMDLICAGLRSRV